MNYRALLFLSFFPLIAYSMELSDELHLLAECTDQVKWQPISSGWKPWDQTALSSIIDYSKSERFLRSAAQSYEYIRTGAFEDPDFFTKEYLVQTSIDHTKRLNHIVNQYGWPSLEKFDAECAQGAWQIAQHADHNPEFQASALDHLGKLKTLEARKQYAYLLDKILINRGEPQFFGTQANNKGQLYPIKGYHPKPTDCPETQLQLEVVNQRRASVGLSSLEESQAKLSQFFGLFFVLNDYQAALPSQ